MNAKTVGTGMAIVTVVLCFIMGMMVGCPQYNVWRMGMSGQADLRQAEQTRRIQVEQAKAELEAASIRAEAIAIVGKAAKEYPEYRQQEFIGAYC